MLVSSEKSWTVIMKVSTLAFLVILNSITAHAQSESVGIFKDESEDTFSWDNNMPPQGAELYEEVPFVNPSEEPYGDSAPKQEEINVPLPVHVPYANSPVFLTRLAKMEREVYNTMTQYEKELRKRLQILQSYRRDYEDSVLLPLNINPGSPERFDDWANAVSIASNPLLAYRMIRRYSKYINEFNEHIWKSLENGVFEKLESIRGHLSWPAEADLDSVTRSLIRIQDTHDFDINFFASGVIQDHRLQIGLSAEQCLEISKTALIKLDVLRCAVEWFQIAHSKVTLGRTDESIGLDELTEVWEMTYKKFQTVWPMTIFKTHDVFSESKALLRQDFERLKTNRTYDLKHINYRAMCRGDNLRLPAEESDLVCYLDHSVHPFWLLQPLQVEIHSWNPFIYQIYDFVGPLRLLEINMYDTVPGSVVSVESGEAGNQNVYEDKSFTSFWIPDELAEEPLKKLSKTLRMLTHRIGDIGPQTHFSMYAVGNHHDPCVKCIEMDTRVYQYGTPKLQVNLILEEPESGGEVAFTLLGALVRPTRGSLIFINTVGTNGEFEFQNLHGSCPVVIGQKWVITKWIY